jgi:hypothetical protein
VGPWAGLDDDDDDHCHWMAGLEISRGFWLDFSSSERRFGAWRDGNRRAPQEPVGPSLG